MLTPMLRENAALYLQLGEKIAELRMTFYMMDSAAAHGERNTAKIQPHELSALKELLTDLVAKCQALDMPLARDLLVHSLKDPPQTNREFDLLVRALTSDLKTRLYLFVPPHRASYYEADLMQPALVSDDVWRAFPKASEEISLGGSSYAVGMNTASVFHAMRAVDMGLQAIANKINLVLKSGKPMHLAEWREVLDGLNTFNQSIENRPNSDLNKESDLQFYSEVSAQFRFFKNGWRVRTMHARASYTERPAKETIDHVCSFFEILATRLKEQ